MARLAKEVLAEIPDQFLSYMRTRGIKPGPLPPPYTTCPPPAIHPLLARRHMVNLARSLMFHFRERFGCQRRRGKTPIGTLASTFEKEGLSPHWTEVQAMESRGGG
ncbi:Hypothetical protein SMAX5B_022076 [Scophthalmus maximus]|uniref:Uncharacterized protein n=1 Tax=Scophthalmus maximus TaxID=52904 RepID=A0A2U9BUI5_SCOMX|nr:Hypothetical protein SMAX5B_022076 [Scophthalmus maximus]